MQFLPKILLLDEITSALDESNKRNVNELIHHYVRDKNIAVLWVTHDKDEINRADNVITFNRTPEKCRKSAMNEHNITNESPALAMMLVVVAILISNKEKTGAGKDILWSVCRAVVQLIIVGYVLKYIFGVNHSILTLLMVLFICFNAAYNAQKRSKYIDKAFPLVVYRYHGGAGLTLSVLVLSGSIEFTPMQVIPISGMIAGNAMVAVGLCYNNLGQRFNSEQQQIQENSASAQRRRWPLRR